MRDADRREDRAPKLLVLVICLSALVVLQHAHGCLFAARGAPCPRAPAPLATPSGYVANCGARGACSGRGTCLVDKCVCNVGATGALCDGGTARECAHIAANDARLACFYDEVWGTGRVDAATWHAAQLAEAGWWRNSDVSNDRSEEQARGFAHFVALPVLAGAHAEFGCGPFTQTLTSLLAERPELKFSSITLLDPNALEYVKDVAKCSYRSGRLVPDTVTHVVAAGAEARLFTEAFDSLMMVNVLEHTQDAFAVLHNVWASLKPGGVLIFQDMAFDRAPQMGGNPGELSMHPVHLRSAALDFFLSHFTEIFRNDDGTVECSLRKMTCVYYIGRKKTPAELAA